jgi:hypothetical protein
MRSVVGRVAEPLASVDLPATIFPQRRKRVAYEVEISASSSLAGLATQHEFSSTRKLPRSVKRLKPPACTTALRPHWQPSSVKFAMLRSERPHPRLSYRVRVKCSTIRSPQTGLFQSCSKWLSLPATSTIADRCRRYRHQEINTTASVVMAAIPCWH